MKKTSLNLSFYLGKVIHIAIKQNKDIPYIYGTFIGLLQYDNIAKCYVLNHPYNIKTKMVEAGLAAFDTKDVKELWPATANDACTFLIEYEKFHDEVIKEKGCDSCEIKENIIL